MSFKTLFLFTSPFTLSKTISRVKPAVGAGRVMGGCSSPGGRSAKFCNNAANFHRFKTLDLRLNTLLARRTTKIMTLLAQTPNTTLASLANIAQNSVSLSPTHCTPPPSPPPSSHHNHPAIFFFLFFLSVVVFNHSPASLLILQVHTQTAAKNLKTRSFARDDPPNFKQRRVLGYIQEPGQSADASPLIPPPPLARTEGLGRALASTKDGFTLRDRPLASDIAERGALARRSNPPSAAKNCPGSVLAAASLLSMIAST